MDNVMTDPPITPGQHAVLDYGVAAFFFGLAIRYRNVNRPAAALALANAVMVAGMSVFTDYPGGIWKRIPFRTHGTLDAGQAMLAGLGPIVLGFADSPEAQTFYLQAMSEGGVIAITDWEGGAATMRARSNRSYFAAMRESEAQRHAASEMAF